MSGESKIAQAVALGSYFLSGCLAINVSQVLGAPLYLVNEGWYNTWISFTKQSFNLLTITLTQWWAPTIVRVSGDSSMRGQLFKSVEGNLMCNFPTRLILIANHQIYTDWLYLWWIAHCGGAAGRIYIILKESLKSIPVIGWGIQLSQFILLKRNWEKDKPHLSKHLQKLNNHDPMWLLLFPEGTNLAPSTRMSSQKWAAKNSIPDMQHTLHPRTTGLQFCLQELRQTVGYLYDCTIAYEGVPRGQYAQDIYTLQAQYLQGKPPDKVHMYWRRFRISEIPVDNAKSFESWLRARWIEKDAYIEHYYRTGRMPCDRGITTMPDGTKRKGCGYIETAIKATAWHEFLQAFAPIGALSLVLYSLYNQLPQNFISSLSNGSKKAILDRAHSIGVKPTALKKTLTAYSGAPTLTLNNDKVSKEQAVELMQRMTEQVNLSKVQNSRTKSAPVKRVSSAPILTKTTSSASGKALIKTQDANSTPHTPRKATVPSTRAPTSIAKLATTTATKKSSSGLPSSKVKNSAHQVSAASTKQPQPVAQTKSPALSAPIIKPKAGAAIPKLATTRQSGTAMAIVTKPVTKKPAGAIVASKIKQ